MAEPRLQPEDPAVSWRYDVTDSRLLHTLTYALPGMLGGVVLLVALLAGRIALDAVRAGNVGRAVGVLGVAVLALLVRRYVPALLGATDAFDPSGRYSLRGLAASSVVGAAAVLWSLRVSPVAPFALFVASWLPTVLAAEFPTEGRATPETGTLVVDGESVPLDALSHHRTVSVGGVAVSWLSYARGVPRAPRTVVVPTNAFEAVRAVLEDAERRHDESDESRSSLGGAERAIVAAFGLGSLAVGPTLWMLLPPGRGRAVALYGGALFGVFGAVFLWYAATA
ncbi:hypothetical protein [Halopelagius longus]|uniref:Uncharacterized protein n=1 Tax=Halopelagius longus TaxID=1236180 RepID=A0A1H1G7L6_9EURY|nr:hypothetical protein [Halopelagius longus]RDI69799.1 hypothetical protein DWB78_16750 [Halopelagius longus]SDR09055.1 hypothetical protein SAMN05216278_3566 [Halopelagius longus]